MNLRKFVAPTSNAALKMLRVALGPDAVVLSTRHAGGQCEILALPGDEADRLATRAPAPKPPAPPAKPAPAAPGNPLDFESWAKRREPAPDTVSLSPAAIAPPSASPVPASRAGAAAARAPSPPVAAPRAPSPPVLATRAPAAIVAPPPAPPASATRTNALSTSRRSSTS